MNPKISPDHLKRRAVVYIRQSSPGQVIHNQESQRRQYGLAGHARQLGFPQVEVIDEVAEVCTGQVGAVLCIEASRLARNGRDWHHLIELRGLVRTIVIDPDGLYDPCTLNDVVQLARERRSAAHRNALRERVLAPDIYDPALNPLYRVCSSTMARSQTQTSFPAYAKARNSGCRARPGFDYGAGFQHCRAAQFAYKNAGHFGNPQ